MTSWSRRLIKVSSALFQAYSTVSSFFITCGIEGPCICLILRHALPGAILSKSSQPAVGVSIKNALPESGFNPPSFFTAALKPVKRAFLLLRGEIWYCAKFFLLPLEIIAA